MVFIINPGTEDRKDCTLKNAEIVIGRICTELSIKRSSIKRNPSNDGDGGLFGFSFRGKNGRFDVEVPGDDPDEVCAGIPFTSRRLYVDGSSWLYGYAIDAIQDRILGKT